MNHEKLNAVGSRRIASRQLDELIGLARGITADGQINQAEAEFLQKWLAASVPVSEHPVLGQIYKRLNEMLRDGTLDANERTELFSSLNSIAEHQFEIGEVLKSTTVAFCSPAPTMSFEAMRYCFTGTFNYGTRDDCHAAVAERGGLAGSLTQKTNFLVVGVDATESWKHSTFGNKIVQAADWRNKGKPIAIVSEAHWVQHLT